MNNKKYHSGWNHFPIQYGKIDEFDSINKLSKYFRKNKTSSIPVGNFKSYGDCILNRNMIKYVGAKKIILNKLKKTTIVSSNVLIDDLIKKTMPYGFFPPVVPGTKYISIGCDIAADIHGKNHHIDGSFGNHIQSLVLIDGEGRIKAFGLCDNSSIRVLSPRILPPVTSLLGSIARTATR